MLSALAVFVPTISASAACSYTDWAAGAQYYTGNIVKYTNGLHYIAEHDNPGYDASTPTADCGRR